MGLEESDGILTGTSLFSREDYSEVDSILMPINTRTLKRRTNGQRLIVIDNSQIGDRPGRRREGTLAFQDGKPVLRTASSNYVLKRGDEVNLYDLDFKLERFIYQPKA